MNVQYRPVREVWNFKKYLASEPEVWRNEANNLRYAAEVLFLYDDEVYHRIFEEKIQPRLPAFFSARVERMLMGFSLENLIKAILLRDLDNLRKVFHKDGNLSWGRDSHNLLKLFDESQISINNEEKRFLKLWQLCSTWAGRYPLPLNENYLPRQRIPLHSREALIKRSKKQIEKALEDGDPWMGADIHDIMHNIVGDAYLRRQIRLLTPKGRDVMMKGKSNEMFEILSLHIHFLLAER